MTDDVHAEVTGGVGRLTLGRPAAMNALNLSMIRAMQEHLRGWADDDAVEAVVLSGEGKAFCVGADVKAVHTSMRDDDGATARRFLREEYALDLYISRYPKPLVTVLDGVTLGGGVGLSCHAAHRVVTENTRWGMPEVIIGLVPDVGGTRLLAGTPGETGTHLALTATQVGPWDCLDLGFADYFLDHDGLAAVAEATSWEQVQGSLGMVRARETGQLLGVEHDWIGSCYSAPDVETILERLEEHPSPEARAAADLIDAHCPEALMVTLAMLRQMRRLAAGPDGLALALELEYRAMSHRFGTPDAAEGIRAQVLDKDRNPQWRKDFSDVTPEDVTAHFADPAGEEPFRLTEPSA